MPRLLSIALDGILPLANADRADIVLKIFPHDHLPRGRQRSIVWGVKVFEPRT